MRVLAKIVINIIFWPVSELSTIQISASYHENRSNATTIIKPIEICLARDSYLSLIFELQLARAIYGPKIRGRSRKRHNFYVVTLRTVLRKVPP